MANKHVIVRDSNNDEINPTTDETVVLLRRILKVLESNATIDSQQRQKITLDAITAALTLATVTTVGSVGSVGGNYPSSTAGVDIRWQIMDQAKNTYANAIRSQLFWDYFGS